MRQIFVEEIKSFVVNVSETILDENLQDFIALQLEQNSIVKTHQSSIFYTYINSANCYFVALIENLNHTTYIQPQILKAYYKNGFQSSCELFIASDYFAVYEKEELIFFKAINSEVQDEQIENFVRNSLKLNIQNIIKIDDIMVTTLQNEFLKDFKNFGKLNLLKSKNRKNLKQFTFVCIASIFLIIGAYFYKQSMQNKNDLKAVDSVEIPMKKLLSAEILKLLNQSVNSALKLVNVSFQNGDDLDFVIRSQRKDLLIEFLEINKSVKMRELLYNSEVGSYELSGYIRLF